jgi:aspartyl-tRNA(Asn)/glutamyl-tRNA(Gln) amidotransferase subunit A
MNEPNFLTIVQALEQMREGNLRPADLQQACLNQIQRLNPRLNAFITAAPELPEPTQQSARKPTDSKAALPGIPVAVKDLFDTAGMLTTGGSRFFMENVPRSDARAVARLRQEGATIMGKTNTHEVALGVTTVNPHFGACRNPWDERRLAGGSSGGSAVAVAVGMALSALGTDTGGSIRIPASLCGVVGLKPTFGRVSLRGVMPLSWNLDHVGPLTRSVEDAAIMLQVLAGYDADDPTSVDMPIEDLRAKIQEGIRGWRVALGRGDYVKAAKPEVLEAVDAAAAVLSECGARVLPVEVSFLLEAARANKVMTQADAATVHRQRLAEHPDWFGDDVRRRLEAGRDTGAADYIEARRAQAVVRRRLERLFDDFDVLVLPTTPTTAPPVSGRDAVELASELTRFTAPFNLAGMPAISLCCGFDGAQLPIGMQLITDAWGEATLLRAARAYERSSGWHERWPSGTSQEARIDDRPQA